MALLVKVTVHSCRSGRLGLRRVGEISFFFCVCGIFNGMGRFLIRRYSVGIGRNLLRGVSTSQTLHVPDRNVDGRTVPKCASIRTLSIALCDDFAPLLYLLISIRNRKLIYTYRQ